MNKSRYIILAGNPTLRFGLRMLCGNIEQLRLEPFDPNYDFEKDNKGIFITDLTGDLEYNDIKELVDSFYRVDSYPPIVQYSLMTKGEFRVALHNALPLFAVSIDKLPLNLEDIKQAYIHQSYNMMNRVKEG